MSNEEVRAAAERLLERFSSPTFAPDVQIVAHYALEAGQEAAGLYRDVLAKIVGAFTSGIYCANCGEGVEMCRCIIDLARTALSTPGGPENEEVEGPPCRWCGRLPAHYDSACEPAALSAPGEPESGGR